MKDVASKDQSAEPTIFWLHPLKRGKTLAFQKEHPSLNTNLYPELRLVFYILYILWFGMAVPFMVQLKNYIEMLEKYIMSLCIDTCTQSSY